MAAAPRSGSDPAAERVARAPERDHFARFGLARDPRLCPADLELVYLRASRDVHPDHNRCATDEEEAELLARAAELNEAFETLHDPWKRYAYLAELHRPGVMAETKRLDPAFLTRALELAEEVEASTRDGEHARRIELEVSTKLTDLRKRTADLLDDPARAREAATLCHMARYWLRALEVLRGEAAGAR